MEIIIAIASKIGQYLVKPIGREFGYLFNYHSNLESLRGEIKKLFDKKDGVQGLVDAAKRNGLIIKPDVQSWLQNVNDDMVKKVLQFEVEINKRCVCQWSLSRKAYKIKQDVLQLQNGGTFENVAHPAPPPAIWSTFEKGFKDFQSRKANMNEVIEGLKREEVRMIGICGMGGVGKTTMVKEIITRLAKLNLFDKIVMATVSHSPSIRTIQSEIADEIGLQFKEESEPGRARRLHGRLMGIERILIVLDDAWTELGFAAIGLPYGDAHKGCKVLLTSRDSDVCNRMGSQQIIAVPILTTEESQELFREMVGESFNNPDLRSIAQDVLEECGGLPIAIVTVGKALEKKNKHEWDDALNQLRNSTPVNIPGVNDKVYSSIKWSYDRLESDEARSCILLCCIFPEDYDIPIEYLVRYGWGRGYFSNCFTLEDTRNRVHSLVDQLQRRFLLIDSSKRETTKMHDIVRDVAISIASRDPHGFLIRSNAENNGWSNLATYDHYTTISLVGKLEIPVGLKCPKLELLQTMKGRFSEGSVDIICDAMEELKVLALVGMEMEDLGSSRSLGVLKNLRTLCLDGSKFDGMSTDVIGSLENLEILTFRDCDSMRELPREIGRLKQLRLLDTTNCRNLEVIPHGIFSSLCRLEELYMLGSFKKWEIGTGREDKGMASISEVMSLSHHLKVLAIEIPSVIHLLPKDIVLKSPTIRFAICFATWGGHFSEMSTCAFENCLGISKSDARELESQAVRLLLKKCKKLYLYSVKNFSVLTDLDQEVFQDLNDLRLVNCPNTEYLANGISTINKLRFLQLEGCGVLKYVFSLSAARNLVQLQKLDIGGCDQIEEIVSKQGREHEEEADMISFHKLTILSLWCLQSLVGFFQANKLYSNQEEETTARVEHQSAGIFEKAIFPSKCISWFPSLEEVHLKRVKFEGVLFDLKIHRVMDGQTTPIFPQLRKLEIFFCSLTHLWKNIPSGFQGFQNLRYLEMEGCSGLEYVFLHLIARELLNLEEVKISGCPDMETIVRITEENEEEATKYMNLFPKLNTFELKALPRLTSLWSSTKNMHVKKCENLKTVGAVIPQRKKLENKSEMDSTSHDFSTSRTPYSRANAHRSIEILPRPINLEVTPTNIEDSNDDDNLANLRVHDCASLEVIFQLKGLKHEESSHSVEAFNKLRSLHLYALPSLTCLWETGSSQQMFTGSSFGNLKSVEVHRCNQLKYLFSSSIVKLLVSVENIKVHNCEQMEEIVAAEEETAEIITLPKVKSINLMWLPKLKYFCGEAYTLNLPSLELLEVVKVQSLRPFDPQHVDTHNPWLQVKTAFRQEWTGTSMPLRNIYDTSKDEDDEIDSEDEDDEIEGEDEDDEIDDEDEDDETNREDEHN
ncbi:probable disease resistance protein At4g27220 isoform X1 [Malus sylvestris]|uniref:probable disease resistance protein At4g27220 isoform X1 n=2 Tax=Malus sylvestris TaxID=3752 RepID=UPI0021AD1D28|nr:probable disease resistance protein At4g27220 isoform X1 [Malus sylvestris]XP_050110254.1 probable disease resistance protein At4g27220 isoform X1 [Malus sylvestris]XP_050110255.1 probable disease resistance protein At4g27220 isoform X1 [Malus sylvestris]